MTVLRMASQKCKVGESVSPIPYRSILPCVVRLYPHGSPHPIPSAMEDAHAAVLDLDEGKTDSNTFFAVYDGHGGMSHRSVLLRFLTFFSGGTVAKYAGENVHKRLLSEETYQQKQYEAALKRAFLGTDEDLLASKCWGLHCLVNAI